MNLRRVSFALGMLAASTSAAAQQFDNAGTFQLGSFDVKPSVDIGFRHDDNVTRASEDEISSVSQIISPELLFLNSFGASQYQFGYRLRNETFYSSSDDNYTDHFLTAGVDYEINLRHRLNLALDYQKGHEARGTGFSIGQVGDIDEPDQYSQSVFDVVYSFGAPSATGRLDINANVRDRDYDEDTDAYKARDMVTSLLAGTFFYRVGAATDLTFDLSQSNVDYDFALDPENPLDSTVSSALIGLQWEATAKTSGFAKIGYEEKDFDSAEREDFSGTDWAIGVQWQPIRNASINFSSNNNTNETNGEGNFIRTRDYRVEWSHQWLERLKTSASYRIGTDRYEGQVTDLGIRSDDNKSVNLTAYYQFKRWFNLEFGYTFDSRESNRAGIDYDRNAFLINAYVTL